VCVACVDLVARVNLCFDAVVCVEVVARAGVVVGLDVNGRASQVYLKSSVCILFVSGAS